MKLYLWFHNPDDPSITWHEVALLTPAFRSGVGTSASIQEMFYVKVTDVMKTGPGGGNPEEGEMIDLVEVPIKESLDFVMKEDNITPVGMMFAVLWYYQNKDTL